MFLTTTTRTQYFLAGNLCISHGLLDELSQSADPRVRARVAENPNTAPHTLLRLSRDKSAEVRNSVASNQKLPAMALRQLAEDSSADVRYAIAEDSRAPHEILRMLTGDENPYVAHRALNTLSRLGTLNLDRQAVA